MPAYTLINRVLNVAHAVHSIRSLYKLLSSYRDREVSRSLSNIYDGVFHKKNNNWMQAHNQTFLMAWEISWNQGTLISISSKTHFVKKGPRGKYLGVFSSRYSENYILNGKFNPKIDTIRAFFPKIRALFSNFKKEQGRPPSLPQLNVCECDWIYINIPEYT